MKLNGIVNTWKLTILEKENAIIIYWKDFIENYNTTSTSRRLSLLKWINDNEFIRWHHNRKYGDLHTLFNMNPELYLAHITTSKREIDEIKKQGLKMFMSTKCVNRTNGCFDYVNPLLFEEWTHIHNIILYYYYHYI